MPFNIQLLHITIQLMYSINQNPLVQYSVVQESEAPDLFRYTESRTRVCVSYSHRILL